MNFVRLLAGGAEDDPYLLINARTMPTTIRKSVTYFSLLAALLCTMSGCKAWRLDEESVPSSSNEEIRISRPLDPTTKSFGFSSKARDIERNVGIQ